MKKTVFTVFLIISVFFLSILPANGDLQEKSSSKKIITITDQPANAPFSPAILINDTLFISGQLSMNPETGKFEGETMAEQAELVIKNIKLLCNKAGMDLSHVVATTVYISDFSEFREFNNVFVKMFPKDPPTRATVQVAKLAFDAKIEISAIAVK